MGKASIHRVKMQCSSWRWEWDGTATSRTIEGKRSHQKLLLVFGRHPKTVLSSGLVPLPHTLLSNDIVETKAFKIIGISHDEAETMVYHFAIADRSVASLSSSFSFLVLHPLPSLSALIPRWVSAGCTWSTRKSLLMKLPKSRTTAHLHSFVALFPHLWNKLQHSLPSHSSL